MRRNLTLCCVLVSAAAWALGCKENQPPADDVQDPGMTGLHMDVLEPEPDPYVEEDYATYDTPEPAPLPGDQTYTVQRKDTLYSIARVFYAGDESKWRLIYEANRERITDPNMIYVGMKLIIPRVQ